MGSGDIFVVVERSTNEGWLAIATLDPISAYADTRLIAATTYYYRIRIFNVNSSSDYTNIAVVTTLNNPPTAPSNLTATTGSACQINLAWTDTSNNESGFIIDRALVVGGPFTRCTLNRAGVLAVSLNQRLGRDQ